jgi:acetoin utilization deacetylase AcuC-like enzyme
LKVVLNSKFEKHDGQGEFHHGRLVPCFENPSRLNNILGTLKEKGVTDFVEPEDFGLDPILKVHDADYVTFLQNIWDEWTEAGNEGDVMPYVWPVPGLKRMGHDNLNAKVGSYAFSSDTPIMAGTWSTVYEGAQSVLTALNLINSGERAAFALTRPPGHHAHAATYGGYCFLNNVAITAQAARDGGAKKVCILDVDYHHGNGTQDIFYDRDDVLTVSLHGDPKTNFPYFLGYENENNDGNLNLPLPDGATFEDWSAAFEKAADRIKDFDVDVLVVALGVDTFEGDPISKFKLTTEDYLKMGRLIGDLGLPSVIAMEGGYDVGPIGENVYNVLAGFEASQETG